MGLSSRLNKSMSVSEKIRMSFDASVDEVRKINEIDRSRVLGDFDIEYRRNKLKKDFKRKMIKHNRRWSYNLNRYKKEKVKQFNEKNRSLMIKLDKKFGLTEKKREEIEAEKRQLHEIRKQEYYDSQLRTRKKIINHLDKVEKERTSLQKDLLKKGNYIIKYFSYLFEKIFSKEI